MSIVTLVSIQQLIDFAPCLFLLPLSFLSSCPCVVCLFDCHASSSSSGYTQVLYRGFNAFMNWSFCYTSVAVMASISVTINTALFTGGSAVIIYSWLIGSFFTILTGLSMAEICSTYPSAGSVYHWAGSLAPAGQAGIWSFFTGWFNLLGNTAGDASYAFLFAQLIASAVQLGSYDSTAQTISVYWSGQQIAALAIAVSVFWGIKKFNAFRSSRLF